MSDGDSEAPQQSHRITTTPQHHEVLFEQHTQEYNVLAAFCHATYGSTEVPSPQVIIHPHFERVGKGYVRADKLLARKHKYNRFMPAGFEASWDGDWKPKPDSQVMVAYGETPRPGSISSIFDHIHLVNGESIMETLAALCLWKAYNGQDP